MSRSDIRTTASVNGHSAYVRAAVRVFPRLSIQGAYMTGVDNFDRFSIDRIGDFRAQTYSAGVRIYLPTMTAIVAQYDFQARRRGGNRDMGRATVSLMQTF